MPLKFGLWEIPKTHLIEAQTPRELVLSIKPSYSLGERTKSFSGKSRCKSKHLGIPSISTILEKQETQALIRGQLVEDNRKPTCAFDPSLDVNFYRQTLPSGSGPHYVRFEIIVDAGLDSTYVLIRSDRAKFTSL